MSNVRVVVADGVMEVVLARPQKKNALTAAMYQRLAEALADADADPAVRCVLAEPGGVHAGHVAWRPSVGARRGPEDPDGAYLAQLYAEPAWWGTSLATRLMAFAVDGARAAGFKRMSLVTPASAGRARRFYERVGWRTAGPAVDDARFGMPTIAYAREL